MYRPDGGAARTVKVKAIFFLLLLGGHEAVRVEEQASQTAAVMSLFGEPPDSASEWADKYREANKVCKWSTTSWKCVGADGGCALRSFRLDRPRPFNDQCRLSDDYLMKHDPQTNFKMMAGLLKAKADKYKENCMGRYHWANPKCKRRMQMMTDALRFMSKARAKKQFFSSMSEADWKAQQQVYEDTLEDLKGVLGEEAGIAMRLKEKIQASPALMKDGEGAVKKMMSLLTKLTMGTEDEKAEAKAEIEKMPDSTPPLSAEEEKECQAKALETTASLEEEGIDNDMDSVELIAGDEVDDEDDGSSALVELSANSTYMTGGQSATVFALIILGIVAISAWQAAGVLLGVFIFLTMVGCVGVAAYNAAKGDSKEEADAKADGAVVKKSGGVISGVGKLMFGYGKCVAKVLLYPVRAVGAFVKAIFSNETSNRTGGAGFAVGFGGPR